MSPIIKRIRLSYKKKAKQKCLFFNKPKTRKRIYINTLSAHILKDIITSPELEFKEGEAYSDNFFLAESFDISDIKINNINIDTRCIINNDFNQLWIPKKPYEFGFVFDFYVAMTINIANDKAEIIGYVRHDDIKDSLKTNTDKINYYVLDSSILRPISDFEEDIIKFSNIKPKPTQYKETDHDIIKEMFTGFLDNDLSTKEKSFFHTHMTQCELCREELLYLYLFDKKIKNETHKQLFIDANAVLPVIQETITTTKVAKEEPERVETIEDFEELNYVEELASEEDKTWEAAFNKENAAITEKITTEEVIQAPEAEEFEPFEEETSFEEITQEPETEEFEPFEEETTFEEIAQEPETEEFEPFEEETTFEEIAQEPEVEEFEPFEEETSFEEITQEPEAEEFEPFEEETSFEEITQEPETEEFEPFEEETSFEEITQEPEAEEFEAFKEETSFEEIAQEPETEEFEPFEEETSFEEIAQEPETEEFEPFEEETSFEEIAQEPEAEEFEPFTPFDEEPAFEEMVQEAEVEDIEPFTPFDKEPVFEEITQEPDIINIEDLEETTTENVFSDIQTAEDLISPELLNYNEEDLSEDIIVYDEATIIEEQLSYPSEEEQAEERFEYTPVEEIQEETIEEQAFLTLEDLEEEHIDTLSSFSDNIDLETIEKSTTIEEPSLETDLSEFSSYQDEITINTEPQETESIEETIIQEDFEFEDQTYTVVEEDIDVKLEDLEEEFNTFASFNFEEEPVSSINIEDTDTDNVSEKITDYTTSDLPDHMFEEHGADISSNVEEIQYEEPKITADEMFETPEGIDNMFDTPSDTVEAFSPQAEDDSFITIGDSGTDFEEVELSDSEDPQPEMIELEYKPDDLITIPDTSIPIEDIEKQEEEISMIPSGSFEEQADQLASELEQQQEEIAPIDSTTESVIPTETEITNLKEFAEKKKLDATTEVKKAKKGKKKKLILLAASLLLIGTVTAGVMVIAPKLGSISNNMMASLPKEDANKVENKQNEVLNKDQTEERNKAEDGSNVTPYEIDETQSTTNDIKKEEGSDNTVNAEAEAEQKAEKDLLPPAPPPQSISTSSTKTPAETKAQPHKAETKSSQRQETQPANKPADKPVTKPETKPVTPPAPVVKEEPKTVTPQTPAVTAASKPAPAPVKKATVTKTTPQKQTRKPINVPNQKARKQVKPLSKTVIASNKTNKTKAQTTNRLLASSEVNESTPVLTQKTVSFIPEKETDKAKGDFQEIQADTETREVLAREKSTFVGGSVSAPTPQNELLAGLTDKKETIKQALNPNENKIEEVNYISNASVYWKPTSSKRIEDTLKGFINSSTQKAKASIISNLKNNNISGQLNPTTIIIKINNSTNSITATIGSTSGSSKVDNLILNAVRKSFSAGSLPKENADPEIIKIKLIVALQH